MSEKESDNNSALIALIDVAEAEIAEAIDSLTAKGSASLLQLCRDHLETLTWAAEMGGLTSLHSISVAIQNYFNQELTSLSVEKGAEFMAWLSAVRVHASAPEDAALVEPLLNPLPEQMRASTQAEIDATGAADLDAAAEIVEQDPFAGNAEDASTGDPFAVDASDASVDEAFASDAEDTGADEFFVTDASDADPFASAAADAASADEPFASDASVADIFGEFDESMFAEDEDSAFDTGSMLGMLASELHQAMPQLNELADVIVTTAEDEKLERAVESYQELVSRIKLVADELNLNGLVLVSEFVNSNVARLAALPLADRPAKLQILGGWPEVIIAHLTEPLDDDLCISVIDYLEDESWPEPLPYREIRNLIEGLTRELELSGDFAVEKRQIEATEEDVALEISADVSEELKAAFFDESPGHAETFSQLMEAISMGEDIQLNVESAQRIAHTLKGSGNLVGAKGIANLSHHIEDIFEYIAAHKMTPPQALADTMQEAADTVESMLEYLQGIAPPPDDSQRVLQDVLDWANRIDAGSLRNEDFDEGEPESLRKARMKIEVTELRGDQYDRRGAADAETGPAATASGKESDNQAAAGKTESVRVAIPVLDNVFRIVSETAITIGQIQERLNRLEENDKLIRNNDTSLQIRRYELENLVSIRGMAARHRSENAKTSTEFDPLEMDEYDEFYGATHAYIEGVADSRHILRDFTNEVSELGALFLLQQRLNKELQEVVMTTRMIPVNSISARLLRTVRQACRMTGKQAELVITGDDLLLDGDVLNRLANPLMHVLRNAVDHGVESVEQRQESGKAETGKIELIFRQEGNSVIVECIDDGKGLNYDRIREIAISRGLMSEQDELDNPALSRMILRSGFSTSETITQVSGRGVGMDVVHDAIQALNGSMEVGDAPGGGALVSLRLPITLLTSHCLLADIGDNKIFAIPTSSLTQILSPGTGELSTVGENMTYRLGQEEYAVQSLSSLLGIPEVVQDGSFHNSRILLVPTADGIKAVTVEHVVSSYDLVIKNMGAYVKALHGVAGVSILGDGSVVVVLDLANLLQEHEHMAPSQISPELEAQIPQEMALPKVMVVDDSLSVRSSLSQLMSDGGYRVVTARDGLEAVNMLEAEMPDIILTDLEMPRMNGLDLVGYIRNSVQWSPLPVVMITSRTMAKHREQAETAGVNCYITKPFTEDEVLESIDQQLAQAS